MLQGTGANRVLIVGTDTEFDGTVPFAPNTRSGSVVERAIRRIAADRAQFLLWQDADLSADKLDAILGNSKRIDCILALGNEATSLATGLAGDKLSVSHLTGYLLPPAKVGWPPVVPMFHPSFLRQGHMNLFGILMRTLRLTMQVAKEQRQPLLPPVDNPPEGYILYPTEADAEHFLEVASTKKEGYLAYDIETNYSNSEEDAEERFGEIRSVQFSLARDSGIFLPWREPFIPIAKRLLRCALPKLNWNGWRFDDPLLRSVGARPEGAVIDLMWAWHHAQPDLPRGLQFAMAMQGSRIYTPSHSWPWPWKHLDRQSPQFYGLVDVDVLQWAVSY